MPDDKIQLSEDQFNYILCSVVEVMKKDMMPLAQANLEKKVYGACIDRLKTDIVKIILAARNVKTDDLTATTSPMTNIQDINEYKGNPAIAEFCKRSKVLKLEDIYVRHITDELARKFLIRNGNTSDYLTFVNALKIRGYSLQKVRRTL